MCSLEPDALDVRIDMLYYAALSRIGATNQSLYGGGLHISACKRQATFAQGNEILHSQHSISLCATGSARIAFFFFFNPQGFY